MREDLRVLTTIHLRLLDELAPRLVSGLFITGSVALDDYRPGSSDVDFVAVMDTDPSAEQLAALAAIHRQLPSSPYYDGIYLTRAQLAQPAQPGDTAPQVLVRDFDPAKPGGQLTPVTWLELARYAIAVRGQPPEIKQDQQVLEEWLHGNLAGYWTHWTVMTRAQWSALPPETPIFEDQIIWGVLGPARLRYTLVTGDIISKTGAGRFAAQRYPAWARLCERAIAARDGAQAGFTAADGVAATDLMAAIING